MIKKTTRLLIFLFCLFCFNQTFARIACDTTYKFTNGKNGAAVKNLNVTQNIGTIPNLWLEITIYAFEGMQSKTSVFRDFCSFTYGAPGAMYSYATPKQYYKITYGTSTSAYYTAPSDCNSESYSYPSTGNSPFNNAWIDSTANYINTKAEVFWYLLGTASAVWKTSCSNSKFYIPLSISYKIGTTGSLAFDGSALYNNVPGCCYTAQVDTTAPAQAKTPSPGDLTLRQIQGSCSVTAPPLNLGTQKPDAIRSNGILGGVLKSTLVTLNCNNVYTGTPVTPKVTITDAADAGNTGCNPTNTADNPSNASVNLFTSPTIDHNAAYRYCVSPFVLNGSQYSNTMTFPSITATSYTASMPIYAGMYYTAAGNPTPGPVRSTLTLTVFYD